MKNQSISQLPRARKHNLIIKELTDETLVYDRENDQAHCLNSTAARIWQHCDGQSSISEIAQSLGEQTDTKADDTIVWLALDQLKKFNLLATAPAAPAHLAGMSRRQWVRNVGFAAIALPVIVSISAPTADAQASLLPVGRCCGNPTQCASNNCAQTPSCVPPPPAAPSTKACV